MLLFKKLLFRRLVVIAWSFSTFLSIEVLVEKYIQTKFYVYCFSFVFMLYGSINFQWILVLEDILSSSLLTNLVFTWIMRGSNIITICWIAVTGTLKGYDQLLNLVLDEAVEFLRGKYYIAPAVEFLDRYNAHAFIFPITHWNKDGL